MPMGKRKTREGQALEHAPSAKHHKPLPSSRQVPHNKDASDKAAPAVKTNHHSDFQPAACQAPAKFSTGTKPPTGQGRPPLPKPKPARPARQQLQTQQQGKATTSRVSGTKKGAAGGEVESATAEAAGGDAFGSAGTVTVAVVQAVSRAKGVKVAGINGSNVHGASAGRRAPAAGTGEVEAEAHRGAAAAAKAVGKLIGANPPPAAAAAKPPGTAVARGRAARQAGGIAALPPTGRLGVAKNKLAAEAAKKPLGVGAATVRSRQAAAAAATGEEQLGVMVKAPNKEPSFFSPPAAAARVEADSAGQGRVAAGASAATAATAEAACLEGSPARVTQPDTNAKLLAAASAADAASDTALALDQFPPPPALPAAAVPAGKPPKASFPLTTAAVAPAPAGSGEADIPAGFPPPPTAVHQADKLTPATITTAPPALLPRPGTDPLTESLPPRAGAGAATGAKPKAGGAAAAKPPTAAAVPTAEQVPKATTRSATAKKGLKPYAIVSPGVTLKMEMLNREGRPTGRCKQLLVVKELGSGGNATVWRVREQQGQSRTRSWWGRAAAAGAAGSGGSGAPDMALKVAMYYEEMAEQYRERCSRGKHGIVTRSILCSEHCIMEDTRTSPNVLDSYGVGRLVGADGEEVYCLLLELAEGGSLDQLVRPEGVPRGLSPGDAYQLMKGIIKGLCSMHDEARAIHRDLKCSNIVLTGDGSSGGAGSGAGGSSSSSSGGSGRKQRGQRQPKLIDFDAAFRMGTSMDALGRTWNIGTPAFAAPEMREGYFHDSRVDSFQLGLTFVEMRFGEPVPFHHLWVEVDEQGMMLNEDEMAEQDERREDLVAELDREDCPYNQDWPDGRVKLTAAELDFLRRCLQPDVRRRETVGMLCCTVYTQEGPFADPL